MANILIIVKLKTIWNAIIIRLQLESGSVVFSQIFSVQYGKRAVWMPTLGILSSQREIQPAENPGRDQLFQWSQIVEALNSAWEFNQWCRHRAIHWRRSKRLVSQVVIQCPCIQHCHLLQHCHRLRLILSDDSLSWNINRRPQTSCIKQRIATLLTWIQVWQLRNHQSILDRIWRKLHQNRLQPRNFLSKI